MSRLTILSSLSVVGWLGLLVVDVIMYWPIWAAIHVVGLCVSSGLIIWQFRKGLHHGTNRRTAQDVSLHSVEEPDTGSWTGAAVAIATALGASRTYDDATTPEGADTGLVVGEVVAWRAWQIVGDYLASDMGSIWLPDQPMSGEGVDFANSNGVHAFKSFKAAVEYPMRGARAIGRVRLWGTVVEHRDGFRGEFARPIEIVDVSGAPRSIIAEIHKRYGLDGGKNGEGA